MYRTISRLTCASTVAIIATFGAQANAGMLDNDHFVQAAALLVAATYCENITLEAAREYGAAHVQAGFELQPGMTAERARSTIRMIAIDLREQIAEAGELDQFCETVAESIGGS